MAIKAVNVVNKRLLLARQAEPSQYDRNLLHSSNEQPLENDMCSAVPSIYQL
jgi:hypothetical protein